MHHVPAHNLIVAFFADEPTPQAIEAMEAWLREDPANVQTLAELLMLDGLLLNDQKNIDAAAILNGLLEAEQRAPLVLVDVTPDATPAREIDRLDDPPINFRQLLAVTGYLVMQGLRQPAFIKSAVAAVLLLSAALILPLTLSGPTQPSSDPHDGLATPQGQSDTTTHASPIASITNTHNATWGSPGPAASSARAQAPVTGSPLYPHQRLTLTAGLAEITTRRGAVITLQGPCQIDLTDHDNTLRLQRGTLLASVPPTATGFTVDTPTARIVDIGTEFGVRVNADQATELQVYKGEATLAPAVDGQTQPATRVKAGQAAQATRGRVARITYDPTDRFARAYAFNRFGPSLIAHYAMAQPTSTILRDSTGEQAFDATIIGAQWAQGPRPGTHALDFTGKGWDERVVLGQEASDRLDLQGDFTIALWVNLRELSPEAGWSPILTKGNDAWRILASRDRKTGEPRIGFYWSQGTEVPEMQYAGAVTGDRDIELNRWHHLIVTGRASETGQGATIRLYLDGELKAEKAFPRTLASDSPVSFGAIQLEKGMQAFNGRLGEITFLSRALAEDQARELYTPTHTPPQ